MSPGKCWMEDSVDQFLHNTDTGKVAADRDEWIFLVGSSLTLRACLKIEVIHIKESPYFVAWIYIFNLWLKTILIGIEQKLPRHNRNAVSDALSVFLPESVPEKCIFTNHVPQLRLKVNLITRTEFCARK